MGNPLAAKQSDNYTENQPSKLAPLLKNSLKPKILLTILGLALGTSAVIPSDVSPRAFQDELHPSLSDLGSPQEPTPPEGLPLPLKPDEPFASEGQPQSPLFMNRAGNITTTVEYDRATNTYIIYERAGTINVRPPRVMSEQEYRDYQFEQSMRQHWQQRRSAETVGRAGGILPRLEVGGETFDRIFGSNVIEIIPNVNAELIFGINSQKSDNPQLPENMKQNVNFDFQSKIQANVTGTIGEKLRVDVNYNTEATFEFEDNVKIEYTGFEDEIIQKIEAGNVSLPLPGTLITGSHNLFGFKTQLRFGRLTVTSIFSQQKGESQTIEVRGGAQTREFSIQADEYEANRHFFLSKYFRDTYNSALEFLPFIRSDINIQSIEVWVTNKQNNFDNSRDIVAFVDLGENMNNISSPLFFPTSDSLAPANNRNTLYLDMVERYPGIRQIANINVVLASILDGEGGRFNGGRHFEKLENARRLNPSEFTLNRQLGYISLNMSLNADEILAVAYEYTMNGKTYRVGELTTQGIDHPNALIVKLLKGTNLSPLEPTWDLMMKNIYSMGAYQVDRNDFFMDILYQNDQTGTSLNFLSEPNHPNVDRVPLLKLLSLDNLNSNLDYGSDGMFDFVEGITILSGTGRIIFPVLEPFGRDLAKLFGADSATANRYAYHELYNYTITQARQVAEKNKFRMEGTYRSSSGSEISLNAPNIRRGAVVVTAGGMKLTEGVDFQVDYIMGTVRIINPGLLESGTPIQISLESQSLFNFQTKSLVGSHFDYRFSEKLNVGATVLNLSERPYTKKVSFGNEAVSNTIWGLNSSYKTDANILTRAVDLLPFIETKERSTLNLDTEFAHFIPGHSRAIGKGGTVYIDDFESSKISITLLETLPWKLASTPQGQPRLFPEGNRSNDLTNMYNRSLLSWYRIDHLFLRNNSLTPNHLRRDPNSQSSHFVREILEEEIFPNRNTPQGQPTTLPVLNLAFYPAERGPYNYTIEGLDENGWLSNPRNSWGGMMRALPTHATDFEASNIEYIEFWLMDPFVYDSVSPGGDLFFNLGSISEDILKDGRKAFEHGLPTSSIIDNVDSTVWGYVPTVQSLVSAFDSDPQTRRFQDVGLDGLSSSNEQRYFSEYLNALRLQFGEGSRAYQEAFNDPANDDFLHPRSSQFDANETGILDRYKRFNMTEGNSPTATQTDDFSTSVDFRPDNEDLNGDNTLSDNESYYQYRISLRPQDMEIGKNYITDMVTYNAKFANNERSRVTWYQFKVPVNEYENAIGSIQDFKSIRYMRVFLKNFSDTVILRFATLELVRGEWRKYNRALMQGQEGMPSSDLALGSFDVSTVNIEENHLREPVNYVLPPGVDRVIDPSQSQIIELNEQAMELKVMNLADGDARAVFKNMNLDIRQYKRLMMDIHAEEIPGMPLKDHEITLFVRMGSDYANNYYEYEIPLVLTPHGSYSNNRESDREIVWPRENLLDIDLELLQEVKLARNDEARRQGSSVNLSTVYTINKGNRRVKVCGNPSLSNVRVLMIGVRNPSLSSTPGDDGLPKSGVIWVNELRVSQMEETGGWAANARMSAKLADLGMLTVAGTTIKPGFGSIESKVSDRSIDDFYQYDASTTLQMGRFFAQNRVNIPLFLGYSESFAIPKYNPIDPDVPLVNALDNAPTQHERDSIRNISIDYTKRRSLNLTNVKINNLEGTPKFYDISNVAVGYSFSEQFTRNIKTEHHIDRRVRGNLTYNYNARANNIVPLRNVTWLSHPYLRIIRDFNFNYQPSQVAFQTELYRSYSERQLRNINNPNLIIDPLFSKDFLWSRNYSMNWDLTQALRFDINARNTARIDEPDGIVDRRRAPDEYTQWRDSVWTNLKDFGRNTQYSHQFNLSYNIPINKIPLLDWVSSSARYSGSYRWDVGRKGPPASPGSQTPAFNQGNMLQNSNTIQLTGQLNFTTLYNKSNYLRGVNQKFDQRARGVQRQQRFKTITYEESNVNIRLNLGRTINHNLRSREVTVKVFDAQGNEVPVDVNVRNEMRISIRSQVAVEGARVLVEARVPERENIPLLLAEGALRLMMGVRNFSVSYSETNGTQLPGYMRGTQVLGMYVEDGSFAPGFPFIAGWRDRDIAMMAGPEGYNWLSDDPTIITPFVLTQSKNFVVRTAVEPIPFLKIDLTGNRTFSENYEAYYRYDDYGNYGPMSPRTTGNFNISIISLSSAFEASVPENGYSSEAFTQFLENRTIISNRMGDMRERVDPTYDRFAYNPEILQYGLRGFADGYSGLAQDVLINSFIAAYTGQSAQSITLDQFPLIPMPNWQVTYDGLARINPFKRHLRTLTLTHSYRSTYSIGSYASSLFYSDKDGISIVRDVQEINYLTNNEIHNISINEQLSPLISIDMGWLNSLTTRVEARNTRSLALSLANNQLTDINSWEYIIGAGYRIENLPIQFAAGGGNQRTITSDLRLRVDVSIRNTTTLLRRFEDPTYRMVSTPGSDDDENPVIDAIEGKNSALKTEQNMAVRETHSPTAGQRTYSIKTSADYAFSDQVTVRLFFDRMVNEPMVSTTFRTANSNFGFSIRFLLSQ